MFENVGDYTPTDVIHWMVDRQGAVFESLTLPFNGLWGRPLYVIDCQGLFCETGQYCRAAAPELTSARKRIKAIPFVQAFGRPAVPASALDQMSQSDRWQTSGPNGRIVVVTFAVSPKPAQGST